MEFRSNAKPSTYAYPAPLEEKKGRETEKVETAVLSTTAKAKAKEIKKEKRKASTASASRPSTTEEKMDVVSFFFVFSYIFILLSRESDQCAIRARLGVAGHPSTTPRWWNPAKCLSQRRNK